MYYLLLKIFRRIKWVYNWYLVKYNAIHWRNFHSYGKDIIINGKCSITGYQNIHVGNNVHFGDNSRIRGEGGLYIGDNTHISRNLVLYTVNHQFEGGRLPYDEEHICKEVRIGKNVWIGMNVIILPGSNIGDGAIIGAGTVISGTVPPLSIAVGGKFRLIGKRNEDRYWSLESAKKYGEIDGREYNVNS